MSCQGLYEYILPKWQARPHPQVDEKNWQSFGTAVPPRPLNPLKGEQQSYAATGKLGEVELPRYVCMCACKVWVLPLRSFSLNWSLSSFLSLHLCSIDRTLKMYVGGAQKRPDAPYAQPVVTPSGKVIGQVGEGNRKDIRDAVEAAHKAAPG